MKNPALLSAIFAACIGSGAIAKTVEDGHVGCVTERTLDEFIAAAGNHDVKQGEALLGTYCFPIGGLEFSVVDLGVLKSQIRVYTKGSSGILWVVSEAAR